MHTTLKQLWMVFVIPIMIGVVLAASGYIGTPRNKGIWIEPQVPLSYYTTTEPNMHYQWTVLYPCQNCEQSTALRNAITTLGTKQSLVKLQLMLNTQMLEFKLISLEENSQLCQELHIE